MSEFMDEAVTAFEEFKRKGCGIENSISSIELRNKGDELQEIIWEFSILLRQNGFTKEAVTCVEHLITCTDDPEPLAQFYMALGQIMEMMKDFEAAILYYLHAKSLKPADKTTAYLVHNNLGYCFNLLGRHEEAPRLAARLRCFWRWRESTLRCGAILAPCSGPGCSPQRPSMGAAPPVPRCLGTYGSLAPVRLPP